MRSGLRDPWKVVQLCFIFVRIESRRYSIEKVNELVVNAGSSYLATNTSCQVGLIKQGSKCAFIDYHGVHTQGQVLFDANGHFDLQTAYAEAIAEAVLDPEILAVTSKAPGDLEKDVIRDGGKIVNNASSGVTYTNFFYKHGLPETMRIVSSALRSMAHLPGGANTTALATQAMSAALVTAGVGAGALGFMAEVLALPFVGVLLYGLQYVTGTMRDLEQWSKALDFANFLVRKSDCLSNRVFLIHLTQIRFGKQGAALVCGSDAKELLKKQVRKTNEAFRNMFSSISSLGKCLFPGGKDEYRKKATDCLANLKTSLRSHRGKAGVLSLALQLAALYGKLTDEMLGEPIYGSWVTSLFQMSVPPVAIGKTNALLIGGAQESTELMTSSGQSAASTEINQVICTSFLATQRAFEVVFAKMSLALEVWVRSYGRSSSCQKVIFNLETFGNASICKHPSTYPGHSNMGCG